MSRFDLTASPFFLLGVGPRDEPEALTAAFEEALAEGAEDEARVANAFHALMLPMPRLQAELRWLAGATAESIFAIFRGAGAPVADIADRAPVPPSPLALANVAAHLCAQDSLSAEQREGALSCLVGAQVELEPSTIALGINANRCIAGFPLATDELVEKGLDLLRLDHRDCAFAALMALPQPAAMLCRLIEEHGRCDRGMRFLAGLVEMFDNTMLAARVAARQAIEAVLSPLEQSSAGEAGGTAAVAAALACWAVLARPSQLAFATTLRDEPASFELGARLRDLALRCERRCGDSGAALALIRVASEAFAALPGLGALLMRDAARLGPPAIRPAPLRRAPDAVRATGFVLPSLAPATVAARQPMRRGGHRSLRRRFADWHIAWRARLDTRRGLRIGLAIGVGVGAFALVVIASSLSSRERSHHLIPARAPATPAMHALNIALPEDGVSGLSVAEAAERGDCIIEIGRLRALGRIAGERLASPAAHRIALRLRQWGERCAADRRLWRSAAATPSEGRD